MPAEWEPHEATWIAWPHQTDDWPGKFAAIEWVYAEIVRALVRSERVEIICLNQRAAARAAFCLKQHHVPAPKYRLHLLPTDRSWLRDSAPTAVFSPEATLCWMHWQFNAWAKYDNYRLDCEVPRLVSEVSSAPLVRASRPDNGAQLVLEGGAIDVDGEGTILVTEECLLSDAQSRNPGLGAAGYEEIFRRLLGSERTIWLGRGCAGDDTHGHIDDIARFVGPGKVVLAFEDDPDDENFESSKENLDRLESSADAKGRPIQVVKLPMPRPVMFEGQRLPASYANFYIGNRVVLVPTFNDPNDRVALNILAELFPTREIIGIHSVDLVWGLGTLHCLTQQQPSVD